MAEKIFIADKPTLDDTNTKVTEINSKVTEIQDQFPIEGTKYRFMGSMQVNNVGTTNAGEILNITGGGKVLIRAIKVFSFKVYLDGKVISSSNTGIDWLVLDLSGFLNKGETTAPFEFAESLRVVSTANSNNDGSVIIYHWLAE